MYASFGYTILKVSSYSTEVEFLLSNLSVGPEFGSTERMVVSAIALYLDVKLFGELFKPMFGLER